MSSDCLWTHHSPNIPFEYGETIIVTSFNDNNGGGRSPKR